MAFKLITKATMQNMCHALLKQGDKAYILRLSAGTAWNCSTSTHANFHEIQKGGSHVYYEAPSAAANCSGCNLQLVQDEVYVQSGGTDALASTDGSVSKDTSDSNTTFCTKTFSSGGSHTLSDQLGWWVFPNYVPTDKIKEYMIDAGNGETNFDEIDYSNVKRPYAYPIYLNDHNFRTPIYDPLKNIHEERNYLKWL